MSENGFYLLATIALIFLFISFLIAQDAAEETLLRREKLACEIALMKQMLRGEEE